MKNFTGRNSLFILLLLFIQSLLSCNKSDSLQSELTIEALSQDALVISLIEQQNALISISPSNEKFDSKTFSERASRYNHTFRIIEAKYGKTNLEYLVSDSETQVVFEKKGGCCERNPDGTTNASCCNFFEYIIASISAALRCYAPENPFGLTYTREEFYEEIDKYYDCVQERWCKNC